MIIKVGQTIQFAEETSSWWKGIGWGKVRQGVVTKIERVDDLRMITIYVDDSIPYVFTPWKLEASMKAAGTWEPVIKPIDEILI